MIPNDVLVELVGYACDPWGKSGLYEGAAPTASSLSRIEAKLGIQVPGIYRYVAERCPLYGGWFASLGENYDHPIHILNLNTVFHTESEREACLPQKALLFTHGHDGYCVCWDLEVASTNGEHPIVEIWLEGKNMSSPRHIAWTFREYLESFCRDLSGHTRESRRKAEQVLAKHQIL